MKNEKKKFIMIIPWQYTQLIDTLEKMEAKGYKFKASGKFLWKFERCDPKHVRYAAKYVPEKKELEPAATESELAFAKMCMATGWELVDPTGNMHIYRNENPQAIDLDTDALSQLDLIHRSTKSYLSISSVSIISGILILLTNFVMPVLSTPMYFFTDPSSCFITIFWLVFVLWNMSETLSYYSWRRKARRLAETENLLPRSKRDRFTPIAMMITALNIVCLTFSAPLIFLLLLSIQIAVMTIINFRKQTKERETKSSPKHIVKFFVTLALSLSITVLSIVHITVNQTNFDKSSVPLCLEDFGFTPLDTVIDKNTTVLGTRLSVQTYTQGNESTCKDLSYDIYQITQPVLYEYCAQKFKEAYRETEENIYIYVEDPYMIVINTSWQLSEDEADESFQLIIQKIHSQK